MKYFLIISMVFHTVFFAAFSLFPVRSGGNKNAKAIDISFFEGKGYRPEKKQIPVIKKTEISSIIKPETFEKKTVEKLKEPESIPGPSALNRKEASGPVQGSSEVEAGYGHGPSNSDPETTAWFSSFRERVESYKRSYPKRALEEEREGKVILRITVESNGILEQVTILNSSGSQVLDEEALRLVKRASPFKPCPSKMGKSVTFRMPIKFEVTKPH